MVAWSYGRGSVPMAQTALACYQCGPRLFVSLDFSHGQENMFG